MWDTNKIAKILLLASALLALSACSSGGSGSQSGLNISGRWVGTTVESLTSPSGGSAQRAVTVTFAQDQVASIGVTSVTLSGNLQIDSICLANFTGQQLNLNTNTLVLEASTVSFVGSVTNDTISGTFSSIDDDLTDSEGCGNFFTIINFRRA